MTAASVRGLVATGERAGFRVRRVLADSADVVRTGILRYALSGFSLYAATQIEVDNRDGIERLCRHVARPPLAAGRLTQISANALWLRLKTPWDDGTNSLIFSLTELLEKLSTLLPSPTPYKRFLVFYGRLSLNADHL